MFRKHHAAFAVIDPQKVVKEFHMMASTFVLPDIRKQIFIWWSKLTMNFVRNRKLLQWVITSEATKTTLHFVN